MKPVQIIILMMLISSVYAGEEVSKNILSSRGCDSYLLKKDEYDRLGLNKGAKLDQICVTYLHGEEKLMSELPLFENGELQYKNAVLLIISDEESGFCLTFAGLKRTHFTEWFHDFVAENSDIQVNDYSIH